MTAWWTRWPDALIGVPTAEAIGYVVAALDKAARAIINAPGGEQEATLNAECFSIGTLSGAGNAAEEIRIELTQFNGHDLLKVRVWTDPRNGGSERIPTRAGIAC